MAVKPLGELERLARGLRKLRPLHGAIVVLRLELHEFTGLRKCYAERVWNHATRGGVLKVAGHLKESDLEVEMSCARDLAFGGNESHGAAVAQIDEVR